MSTHFAQPATPGQAPAAPNTNTTQPAAPAPAHETGGGGSPMGGQSWLMLVMFLPIVLILLMSRNQTKKQKQLEESLKVGDRIVTQSGLLGRVIDMDERLVKLEIAPGVKVEVLKSTIQGKYVADQAKTDKTESKDDAKEKAQEKKA